MIVHGDPCATDNHLIIYDKSILTGLTGLLNAPAPISGEDHRLYKPQPTNGVPGFGVFTLCGAASTADTTAFVPGLSELYYVWACLLCGDDTRSSPGGTGSTKLSYSVIEAVGMGFPHRAGKL